MTDSALSRRSVLRRVIASAAKQSHTRKGRDCRGRRRRPRNDSWAGLWLKTLFRREIDAFLFRSYRIVYLVDELNRRIETGSEQRRSRRTYRRIGDFESVYQYHRHRQTPSRGFKETLRVTVFVRGHIPRSPCQRGSAPLDSPLLNSPTSSC